MTALGPLLDVRGLRTVFHGRGGLVKAVDDVSFDVGRGEVVGIVGESGCGKSATVRSVLGLVQRPGKVVGGTAELGGDDLLSMKHGALRRVRGARIGFVAQNPFDTLNPILRLDKQFHHVVRAHRQSSRAESRRLAVEMLSAVRINDPERVLDGYAHQLSGGMAQRFVIAVALALSPELVIADEPTTALDVTVQRQILDLIAEMVTRRGASMLIVTHDLGVVAQYCDRVVVMRDGRVVERGRVDEVFLRPAAAYTRQLLDAVPTSGQSLRAALAARSDGGAAG